MEIIKEGPTIYLEDFIDFSKELELPDGTILKIGISDIIKDRPFQFFIEDFIVEKSYGVIYFRLPILYIEYNDRRYDISSLYKINDRFINIIKETPVLFKAVKQTLKNSHIRPLTLFYMGRVYNSLFSIQKEEENECKPSKAEKIFIIFLIISTFIAITIAAICC